MTTANLTFMRYADPVADKDVPGVTSATDQIYTHVWETGTETLVFRNTKEAIRVASFMSAEFTGPH
jgi:hypothetical protein